MPQDVLRPEQKREKIKSIFGGKHIGDEAKNKDVADIRNFMIQRCQRWGVATTQRPQGFRVQKWGVITKQKPQDCRSQIDLKKTQAYFWTCGLDYPEPEQPEYHQLNKL